MTKSITNYSINLLADSSNGLSAQILFFNGSTFSGRIDFYRAGTTIPNSYLWHPNGPGNDSTTYIVLAMRLELLETVASAIRNEGPWAIEIWPSTTPAGASTNGYGGKIYSIGKEPIGEEERSFQSGAV